MKKGNKKMNHLCSIYGKMHLLIATLSYTILTKKYKDPNIFKIIDEITFYIKK